MGAGVEAAGAGFFGFDLGAGRTHRRAAAQGVEHLGPVGKVGRVGGGVGMFRGQTAEGQGGEEQGKDAALHASLPLASAGTIQ